MSKRKRLTEAKYWAHYIICEPKNLSREKIARYLEPIALQYQVDVWVLVDEIKPAKPKTSVKKC